MDVTIGNRIKWIAQSITRPANTTAYAAGDAASDTSGDAHYTFPTPSRAQSGGVGVGTACIEEATLLDSANQATLPDLELWLFRVDPAVVADNAAIAFTDAELAELVGVIDFPQSLFKVGLATSGAGGNAVCHITALGINFIPKAGANNLYGQLVVRNAYTPVSGEVFTVTLKISQD